VNGWWAHAAGQPATRLTAPDPKYFQSRPSAAGAGYDPTSTGASNLGPSNLGPENKTLITAISNRRAGAAPLDGVNPAQVAPDALRASASGLDPHTSPAYADEQVARVTLARGLQPATVAALVTQQTRGTHQESSANHASPSWSSTSPSMPSDTDCPPLA
jgi:K+-transporting ATPase c subunit